MDKIEITYQYIQAVAEVYGRLVAREVMEEWQDRLHKQALERKEKGRVQRV